MFQSIALMHVSKMKGNNFAVIYIYKLIVIMTMRWACNNAAPKNKSPTKNLKHKTSFNNNVLSSLQFEFII
jgi:hypothetical protein